MTTLPEQLEGQNDVNSTENAPVTNDAATGGELYKDEDYERLVQFLEKNDLFDIKDQILSSKLKFSHFKLIEMQDLDDLCNELKLSTPQRIRLKHSIKLLQKKKYVEKAVRNINISSKIVIVGDAAVGKSTLQKALMGWEFEAGSKSTFACNSIHKKTTINNKEYSLNIDYELVDTPGLQRFADIITLYLRGALAVIVVFDIVNKVSFDRAKWWIHYLENNVSGYDKIILIANKMDIKNGTKGDSETDIKASDNDDEDLIKIGRLYATEHGISFLEISAMFKENVDVLLKWIKKQSENQIEMNPEMIEQKDEVIHLDKGLLRNGGFDHFLGKMNKVKCCGFV